MSGFEVVIGQMHRAAQMAADAADVASRIDLGAALDPVVEALPGTDAIARVAALAASWDRQVRAWANDTTAYATNLTGAAESYFVGDGEGAAELRAAAYPWLLDGRAAD